MVFPLFPLKFTTPSNGGTKFLACICIYWCMRQKHTDTYPSFVLCYSVFLFVCLFLRNGFCLFLLHLFGSLFLSWVAPLPGLVMTLWQQSWGWVRTRPGVSTEGLCCESLASFVSVKLSVCFKPCLGNASKNTWAEGVVTSSRGCEGCRKYKGKGWKLFQPPLSPEDPSHGVTR